MKEIKQWQRVAAYAAMLLCAIGTALYLGQDQNWDMLNYHVYAGYSAVEGRLGIDYFAAGTQSYLNPYSHVPLYLMIKNGFSPKWVVALLALFQAMTLLLVYEIAILLNRRPTGEVSWLAVGLAVLLAFFNPIFLLELGNTFNEVTTGVLVLGGWYILVRQFDRLRALPLVLAGLLIGVAIAFKLSNLMFSVTALPLLLMASPPWKARVRAVIAFAVGGLAGTVLAGGWWAWQLWGMFRNPFFPMFNHIFHSPEMTDGALKHYRFIPDSLGAFLLRPFEMAMPLAGIHAEGVAPDLRFAALLVLLALGALKLSLSTAGRQKWPAEDPFPAFQGQRALLALAVSLGLVWLIWLASSGNSRYFLPMGSIAAVVLASMIVRFSANWRYLGYCVLPLVVVQAATVVWASDLRWTPKNWGATWLEPEIPAMLRQQPYLYLHTSPQSASFLMPYLAPGSSMINPAGSWTMGDSARMRALMQQYSGRIRVMSSIMEERVGPAGELRTGLVRFGLEANMDSCLIIKLRERSIYPSMPAYSYYLTCEVRPLQWSPQRREAFASKMRQVDALLDRLELACPLQFQPRGLVTESDGKEFWRHYNNTDVLINVGANGKVVFHNEFRRGKPHIVGNLDALQSPALDLAAACRGTSQQGM
jgi:hypothetical protein